jgi:signal transduction histidine kinase
MSGVKMPPLEIEVITKNGRKIFAEINGSFIEFGGKNKMVLAIMRDITERRRLEDEILRRKKFEMYTVLSKGIAHDFNNLLTVIQGNIELSKKYLHGEEQALKLLAKAEKKCEHAADLLDQFHLFSEQKFEKINPALLEDILNKAVALNLEGTDIKHSLEISENLHSLKCDMKQLNYVINQFLSNAQEAMPSGGSVRVKIINEDLELGQISTLAPGKYIKITIQDTGEGIPPEKIPEIFNPYYSTKNMVTRKGLGLGLFTSYAIMLNHAGYIDVQSEIGVGSIFKLYFPAFEK